MKKLSIVCGSLAHGGAERVSVYLAKYMSNYEVECSIITMTKAAVEYDMPEGVNRYNATDFSSNLWLGLRKAYKKSSSDTILVMGVSNCIYAIPPLMGLGKKVIVSERNSPMHFAGKWVVRTLSRLLMRLADGYVFQTEQALNFYSKSLHGKGVVIPNPLITDNLPLPYDGIRENRIVTVGRLVPQKNQEILIDVCKSICDIFPSYILEIYGEGPLKNSLQEKIDESGLHSKILLKGNVNDVFQVINKASIFVLTSNFEGMPNALIEAMALGIPCISSDCPCGGPKFLIDHGINGLLFEVNNVSQLKECIKDMLSNKEKAEKMGKNAIKIREKLDADKVANDWFIYLNGIANN